MKHVVALLGVAALLGGGGCGTSNAPPSQPASAVVRLPGSNQRQIVLSPDAVQRLGIQTRRVTPASRLRARVSIPDSAVVYAADGRTYAFTNPDPFAYREVPVRIRTVVGKTAYLTAGPRPGTRVVTVGAEELFGVQTGVLGQT